MAYSEDLVDRIVDSYSTSRDEEKIFHSKEDFNNFLETSKDILLLDYREPDYTREDIPSLLQRTEKSLLSLLTEEKIDNPQDKVDAYLNSLPEIRRLLSGSARAILHGDPAADSIQEIVICYPGFIAITNYRIANQLYRLSLPFLARLIAQDGQRRTGIDINPGATIGENFFIDHGTGIVVGQTCVIGDNVKLYQGVTLGALSLAKGSELKGQKRHPTIEDNCTIYSCASIFGGDTIIGEGSTIGSNTYITRSIPKRSVVYNSKDGTVIASKDDPSQSPHPFEN